MKAVAGPLLPCLALTHPWEFWEFLAPQIKVLGKEPWPPTSPRCESSVGFFLLGRGIS
jgi:hypothetical protein